MAETFRSRWFQEPGGAAARIRYAVRDDLFEAIDPHDAEATALIDYLGFNDHEVHEARRKHVRMVNDLLDVGDFTPEQARSWVREHPDNWLSFPTALEAHLGGPLLDG